MRAGRSMVNVFCSLLIMVTNTVISLFLSPFIIKNIGIEANGYIKLAGDFVMVGSLISGALNSMACRSITIEYAKKNYTKANLYYNSVFWGNLIIVGILMLPAIATLYWLQVFIDIPANLLWDVKMYFALGFLNFFIITGFPNWECGTYLTNRLDRDYIPQVFAQIVRCVVIVGTMVILAPHVWYVGLASIVVSIIMLTARSYNTHKLTPELKIIYGKGKAVCSFTAMKELIASGMWNSISSAGLILLSGLDMLICNRLISPEMMGVLSVTTIMPNLLSQLSDALRGAFAPELTIDYASTTKDTLYKNLKKSMNITGVLMVVPFTAIVVFSSAFYKLWVPSVDTKLLVNLSILSIFGFVFTCGTQVLYNVFQTANKVRENAIAVIISGVVSIVITLIGIKYFGWGIYAVAGVSTAVNLVRNMTFSVPFAAKYLGFKWTRFFPQVIKTAGLCVVLSLAGIIVLKYVAIDSWMMLFFVAAVYCVIAVVVSSAVIMDKSERQFIVSKLRSR